MQKNAGDLSFTALNARKKCLEVKLRGGGLLRRSGLS